MSIGARRVSDDKARLTIHDNGRGYGGEATGSGTGSRLIKALCRQLEGLYWYEIDGGTKFSLEFPVQKGPHHSNA